MRNLIDLLVEGSMLTPTEILKRTGRFEKVISHIQTGKPFYTADGTAVTLDPAAAEQFEEMRNAGTFRGTVKADDTAGNSWSMGAFLKTKDFGGQSVPPGQEDSDSGIGKEAVLLKPKQIGITDQDFSGESLANAIVNNRILASTAYGRAVIELAKNIVNGQDAIIPDELLQDDQMQKAIVDYAGEYLGVLALVYDRSKFTKKEEFLKWLGGNLSDLTLRFPGQSNIAIADSFATITNPVNQHQINISSKGTGGGAAPSLSGLKIPDSVKKKSSYKTAVDLIELCQNKNLPKPLTISQSFLAMNLLHEREPDVIPEQFNKFLPWDRTIVAEVVNSMKNQSALPEYAELWTGPRFKKTTTDGGKLSYMVKKAVITAVNAGAIPELEAVVLEILDYNFVQQYTTASSSGKLEFSTQWPATIDGVVSVESKSSAADPSKGGFSFKLQPKGSTPSSDIGDADALDNAPEKSEPAAPNIVTGKRTSIKPPTVDRMARTDKAAEPGRERR